MQRQNRHRKAARRRLPKDERFKLEPLKDTSGRPINLYDIVLGKQRGEHDS